LRRERFAWAGGTIPDPLLIVVTGDTHGGKVETLSTTADTTAGEVTLDNFSATNLTEGALYGVAGPGILDGSLLVYSAASGDTEAAYTLNAAPTETGGSVTLTLTKSITVAETSGDVSGGSITNIADTAALVAGVTYGVTGPGIPLGTMTIWGGGTTAALITIGGGLVDTPTESGVALTFSGLPTAASGLITNVSGLEILTVGATYNVSGPGIAKGSDLRRRWHGPNRARSGCHRFRAQRVADDRRAACADRSLRPGQARGRRRENPLG
jgi:hypothetical protein